jgi:hypothetical protein
MVMSAKKVKRRAKERRGLSRLALDRELVNLNERLRKQVLLAGAILTVNRPNEKHVVIEHDLRTVFALQMEALFRELVGVQTLAYALCKPEDR